MGAWINERGEGGSDQGRRDEGGQESRKEEMRGKGPGRGRWGKEQ